MSPPSEDINQLLEKLEILLRRQEAFSKDINALRDEIHRLTSDTREEAAEQTEISPTVPPPSEFVSSISQQRPEKSPDIPPPRNITPRAPAPPKVKSDMEKFVGENLINKIGIAITVIGVAIGAKYSIEHQLISPWTRIILGYLAGLALLGIGIQLKKNYENYSAVLVSGAIAILYFITYAAYSFYAFLPQVVAFALMVVFTVFTVFAAIKYNRQVIAHIGLVGAYAIPFLLGDRRGNVEILFMYMAIINIGILAIAFKKYWKPLYYASFILTWLIFAAWFTASYQDHLHFTISLVFLAAYFIIFYSIFLAYKLIQYEKFEIEDILLLLANSFIFYGLGYAILKIHPAGGELLGLFTLCNALLHAMAGTIIYKQKLADRNLFFLVAGLVLVFITVAIPVQLDGNWVTLLWAFEATLLFWIGRTKNAPVYEKLSYVTVFLTFFSLIHDWTTAYSLVDPIQSQRKLIPILNIQFLTSILCVASFTMINFMRADKKYPSSAISQKFLRDFIAYSLPGILVLTLYYSFRMEISAYWNQTYNDLVTSMRRGDPENYDTSIYKHIKYLKTLWIINYSVFFLSILSFANILKIRNLRLGFINLGINAFILLTFLIQGLFYLSLLNKSTVHEVLSDFSWQDGSGTGIRFISIALTLLLLAANYLYLKQDFMKPLPVSFRVTIELLLHAAIVWIASSEVMRWMDLVNSSHSTKLGLSILWGVYALILIALGIWKKQKHLRLGAIALFGITLLKLFAYDITHLETLAKTIIFISLGLLLLIISFLYHKYKNLISGAKENEPGSPTT